MRRQQQVAAPQSDGGPAAPPPAATAPTWPAPVRGLTVGHVGDPAEQAADASADRAIGRLRRARTSSSASVGDAPAGSTRAPERLAHVRRRPVATGPRLGAEGGVLDGPTTTRIDALRRTGSPLPRPVRERMETGFGTSLAHVRVHDGPEPARLNAALGAQAFTSGDDIFLGRPGLLGPAPDDERVLAHEIAHVLDGDGPSGAEPRSGPTGAVRRKPVRLAGTDGGAEFTDDVVRTLRMTRNGVFYTVVNPGAAHGTVLAWDPDELMYFGTVRDGTTQRPRTDYEGGPVDLASLAIDPVADGATPESVTQIDAGSTGQGAAHVPVPTTLRTGGLITCLGWVLSNEHAAYLTHIVVLDPQLVRPDGLAEQVAALARQFEEQCGAPATTLRLQGKLGPTGESVYPAGRLLDWMTALVPPGVPAPPEAEVSADDCTHVVTPDGGQIPPVYWQGQPITVVEDAPRKKTDDEATTTRPQAPSGAWKRVERPPSNVVVPDFSDDES